MKTLRLVRCGLLTAAMALPLAACDSQRSAEPPPEVTTTDSPAMEGTGPETPGAKVDGNSVDLPGLPVGGGTGGNTQVNQCVTVSWIGDPIPGGVSVVVKDIQVDPKDAFRISGSKCGDFDGCAKSSFSFTTSPGKCSVPIAANTTNGSASLLLFGEPVCADGNERVCDDFTAGLTGAPISLTLPTGSTSASPSEEPQDEAPEEEPSQGMTVTDSTG
jgi:hypothetical protein